MTPTRTRPYRRSGLYSRQQPTLDELATMGTLKADLVRDLGGEPVVSAAQLIVIDLVVTAAWRYKRVQTYLETLPSDVDKRHRRLWRVVKDHQALAGHIQSLLRDLGLERRVKPADPVAALRALTPPVPLVTEVSSSSAVGSG